jgi:hypothetical protein
MLLTASLCLFNGNDVIKDVSPLLVTTNEEGAHIRRLNIQITLQVATTSIPVF